MKEAKFNYPGRRAALVLAVVAGLNFISATQATAQLRVGAARVDITPELSALPKNYEGIHDRIHSRAIVLNNGINSAALIMVDAGGLSEQTWKNVSQKIEKELGIPALNVVLTATHTHSVPGLGAALDEKIFQSVKNAKDKLQPARMGYGEGVSYINVNRNILDTKTKRWWEGANYEGPSDKTVSVISFENLQGEPIAVYYNYAMHAVTAGMLDQVSSDAPGATSKYIEDSYDNGMVALWSTGACGDQNPIYFQQTYDLREIRIKDYASRGQDISNSMPGGGQGLNKSDPKVARLINQQKQLLLSMGQFLGEEVMHVMRTLPRTSSDIKIAAEQKTISLPGRRRTNTGRAGYMGTYEDAEPIDLRLGLLVIDDVAIASVNAEVFNPISTRLKKESPYGKTMMATLTNGRAATGYIPNDVAFSYYTFEVLSSRLRPGFAEDGIVNGILEMMAHIQPK